MAKNHARKWNKTKKNDIVTLATSFFEFYHQIIFSNEKKSATFLNNFCQGQNLAIAALSHCVVNGEANIFMGMRMLWNLESVEIRGDFFFNSPATIHSGEKDLLAETV